METVLKAIADWIKGILTAGIMSNLSGLFDDVNTQVGNIAQQVGTKPSSFEPRVFAMIEALSRNVVLPIAGIILTFMQSILHEGWMLPKKPFPAHDRKCFPAMSSRPPPRSHPLPVHLPKNVRLWWLRSASRSPQNHLHKSRKLPLP